MENMDKKKAIKKTVLWVCAAISLLIVLSELVLPALLNAVRNLEHIAAKSGTYEQGFNFWDADADDSGYAELKNDGFWLTGDGESTYITIGDAQGKGKSAEFWSEYLGYLKSGDCENYFSLFSEKYYEAGRGAYDRCALEKRAFAPQRLYDMEVELLGELSDTETDTWYGVYLVSYSIFHNDGSFRTDIPDGYRLPLVFELEGHGDTLLIKDVYEKPGV